MRPVGSIHVRIDELVLEGFAPGDRHRIGDAVQRELTGIIARNGLSPSLVLGGNAVYLDAGGFETAAGAKPDAIGEQVARAVYGRLAPERRQQNGSRKTTTQDQDRG